MAQLPPIPERLLRIDELTLADHSHLELEDGCHYLWERTSGQPWGFSATNDFVSNLQIGAANRGTRRWYYKQEAIRHAAAALGRVIPAEWKQTFTFVPIPPSKTRDNPGYDSRLIDILCIVPGLEDWRELVQQKQDMEAKAKQISPEERADNYVIDAAHCDPAPQHIVIFDDMVAGGSHFKGMKIVLTARFPHAAISGLFLARAVRQNPIALFELLSDPEQI